jgi:hypothetical protein
VGGANGPEDKARRARERRESEKAVKAEKKVLKKQRYELAIAQPLLTNPRECRCEKSAGCPLLARLAGCPPPM